jgi:hypothetical protein
MSSGSIPHNESARGRSPQYVMAGGLVIVAAALLLPIWSVRFPALLDYPNHLASSFVLGHLHDAAHNFSQFYASAWGLNPYITVDFVLSSLGRVIPEMVAGKIVLSFAVLGLPAAVWFFLRQANPGEDALAVWGLLGVFNIFFFYGFLGYFCSLSLLFLTSGLWLRWLARPSIGRWLLTCLALCATYFTHIFGLLFTAMIIGVYSLTRPRWREWLFSALLFLPPGLCYFISSRAASHQTGLEFRTVDDKLSTFITSLVQGYSDQLDWATLAGVGLLFATGWLANRAFHWNWRWLLVALAMLGAYVALPVGYGDGWNIDIRALPVFFLLLFATVRVGRRGWWLAPIALVLFFLRVGNITEQFHSDQPELVGMAQAFSMTPPNVRVLPIVEGKDEDPIWQIYPHFWAYGVIERGWFSPYLFQLPGLLPLRITTDVYDLDGFWNLKYDSPPNWAQIQEDYDYVWAYDVARFDSGLRTIGDMVYTSGKLKLYRVRKPPAAGEAQQ